MKLSLRWVPVVVAAGLLLAVPTFLYVSSQPRIYEASATLNVSQAAPSFNSLLVAEQLARYYAYRATTRPVAEAVIAELSLPDNPIQLQERISGRSESASSLLTVSARDADARRATQIANAVAVLLQEEAASSAASTVSAETLERDLQTLRGEIDSIESGIAVLGAQPGEPARDAQLMVLQDRLVDRISAHADLLQTAMGSGANALQVVVPAAASESPVEPRPSFMAIQAAMIGVLLAAALAFVVEYLDDRPREPRDVESTMMAPTLATITELKADARRGGVNRLVTLLYPRSPAAESYRRLRATIEFASADRKPRTLLVTSSGSHQGRSVIAANLAIAFAQTGQRVALIDADLHEPSIHQLFGIALDRGLTTLLNGPESPIEAVTHVTQQPGLHVVLSGPLQPNPGDLLSSDRLRQVIAQLAARHDLLLIDSPALPHVLDAAILASFLPRTLVVVDSTTADRRTLVQVRDALRLARADVLGTVLFRTGRRPDAAHPDPRASADVTTASLRSPGSGPL